MSRFTKRLLLALAPTVLLLAAAPANARADERRHPIRVGIVIYEGVELLDFAGPTEVFDAAGHQSQQMTSSGTPLFEVVTVAPTKGRITSNAGVVIEPTRTIADRPELDLIVIPGGETGSLDRNPAFMEWLRQGAAKGRIVMSVCNGAFVLAAAGLLDGGEATTFHSFLGFLKDSAPKTKVLTGRRVVDNGQVVTAGGVSCGIDGALHMVARFGGRKLADSVAAYLEFRWIPEPALEGKYADWAKGGDLRSELVQKLHWYRGQRDWKKLEETARELIEVDPDDGVGWYELGYALIWQQRYDETIEAGEESAKALFPTRRADALYNVACAWSRKGDPAKALDALTRSVDGGFLQRDWAEKDPDLACLRDDPSFKKLLERIERQGTPGKPEWAKVMLERARVIIASGGVDLGVQLLGELTSEAPQNEPVRLALQHALARRDLSPSARSRGRKVLASHPWNGKVALVPAEESGDRIVVRGTVRDASGAAVKGATVQVTQVEKSESEDARLCAWITTGEDGGFEFSTVRRADEPTPALARGVVEAAGRAACSSEFAAADLAREADGVLRGRWNVVLK